MLNKYTRYIVALMFLLFNVKAFSQGNNCSQATPFCETPGGAGTTFPNSTSTFAESGPSYGCLETQPNPAWFFLKTTAAGNMVFNISQVTIGGTPIDVDFICWGPFNNYQTMCNFLTGGCYDDHDCYGNIEDCSYSTAATETMTVSSAGAGNFYVVLITNYNGAAGNITFSQTSGPASDCSITCPSVLGGDGFLQILSNGTEQVLPSTIPCNGGLIDLVASSNTPFGDPITPGTMLSFIANGNTSNRVNLYQNGTYAWCAGGTATSCGLKFNPNSQYDLVTYRMGPNPTYRYDLCETFSGASSFNYRMTDVHTGTVISSGSWVDDGNCLSITIPPGTLSGSAVFSASCGSCITNYGDGWGTFDPAIAANSGPGPHTITYTFTPPGVGCPPYTFSKQVMLSMPNSTWTAPSAMCADASTVSLPPLLSGSAQTGGTWTGAGVSGTTFNPTTAGAGTHNVTYTAGTGGCSSSTTKTIIVNPLPTSTANSTNVGCYGANTGAITITPGGATSPYTYSWSPSGGTSATASNLSAGTYVCTITDAKGCKSTKSVTITQPSSALSSSMSSQNNVNCFGASTGSATVAANGGTPGYTYSWTPSGGTSATASNLAAGNYTCTIKDANNCVSTQTVTIAQPSSPLSTNISAQSNVDCFGNTNGSATVTTNGGTPSYTYSWSPSGGTSATATNLGAGTYVCTITDSKNCTSTQSVTISQPSAALNSSVSAQTNVACYGNSTGAATITANGGTPNYNYSWAPSGGTSATAINLASGTYTCTITDQKGCTKTQVVTITQPSAGMTPSVASQTNVNCFGNATGSATVSVNGGTPGYTYSWSPSGGTSATATNLAVGTYVCTIADQSGCTSTQSVTITQPQAALSANIGGQSNVDCFGNATGSAVVNVSGGTQAYTYFWSPSGGTAAAANNLSVGTYVCTITDSKGCTTTQSVTITQPAATLVAASGTKTDVKCNGDKTGSAAVNVNGGTTPYTYNWLPSGGTAATAANIGAGTYTCEVIDKNGCKAQQIITITEPPLLTVQTNASTFCETMPGTVSATVTGGVSAYNYSWAPNNANTSSFTITHNTASSITYTLTVTDANNCVVVKNQAVTVLPKPDAQIASTDPSKIFYLGDNGVMVCFTDHTDGATQWNWLFNSTETSPAQNPCFQVDKVGMYCVNVVVKNNAGCADKDSICVEVKQKEIIFPNIYTPNSDGKNDLFTINSSGYEKISCEIYSRWGTRLYSWEGVSGGWNGQLEDGRQASDGTYYFTAIFTDKNGKTLKKIGSFMLMR